ncbi:metallophosphoesterase, DNA ligase-associated [Cesiribacter andamanensis AMV16]|uniref:Metallophosphoesterase, DNA ligase-associated n=1 Tax=Cesiribacter andamanensis AMV16 TaxID=1279009 RepID=M7N5E3_9BACT|nr:metallophosphoesterase, DNA ligase-associated [Cesiribacter andamanensis AMV16]
MEIFPFLLTHHPPEPDVLPAGTYALCGHIHPAVSLRGAARQALSLPCYYFGPRVGMLPAFGKFTGFYKIKPKAGDAVYGVLPTKVICLSEQPGRADE